MVERVIFCSNRMPVPAYKVIFFSGTSQNAPKTQKKYKKFIKALQNQPVLGSKIINNRLSKSLILDIILVNSLQKSTKNAIG